jgi:hypothetical protein
MFLQVVRGGLLYVHVSQRVAVAGTPVGIHIHPQLLNLCCKCRIDDIRQRERVIDVRCGIRIPLERAGETRFEQKLRNDVILVSRDFVEDRLIQWDCIRDIERNEDLFDRLADDGASRLGVVPNIHLCGGRGIAADLEGAAHVDDSFD